MKPALVVGITSAFAFGTLAEAQESRQSVSVSGSVGLGLAAPSGLGSLAALSVSTKAGDFVIRAASSVKFDFFGDGEYADDVAVLYGRRRRGSSTWTRAAIGIGAVRLSPRSGQCCVDADESAVGLAAQYDGTWLPSPYLGLGFAGFANINAGRSFAGLVLTLHVGALR